MENRDTASAAPSHLSSRLAGLSLTDIHSLTPALRTRRLVLQQQLAAALSSVPPDTSDSLQKSLESLEIRQSQAIAAVDHCRRNIERLEKALAAFTGDSALLGSNDAEVAKVQLLLRNVAAIRTLLYDIPRYILDTLLPSSRHSDLIRVCAHLHRVCASHADSVPILRRFSDEFVRRVERKHARNLLHALAGDGDTCHNAQPQDKRKASSVDVKAKNAEVLVLIEYLKQLEHVFDHSSGSDVIARAVAEMRTQYVQAAWSDVGSEVNSPVSGECLAKAWQRFAAEDLPNWTTRARLAMHQLRLAFPNDVHVHAHFAIGLLRELKARLVGILGAAVTGHDATLELGLSGIIDIVRALDASSGRLAPVGLDLALIAGDIQVLVHNFVESWTKAMVSCAISSLPAGGKQWSHVESDAVSADDENGFLDPDLAISSGLSAKAVVRYPEMVRFCNQIVQTVNQLRYIAIRDVAHVESIAGIVLFALKSCAVSVSTARPSEPESGDDLVEICRCLVRYLWFGLARVYGQTAGDTAVVDIDEVDTMLDRILPLPPK